MSRATPSMAALESRVLRSLEHRSHSAGRLIEQFQAAGVPELQPSALLVYGALANLAARGDVVILATGAGERVWGVRGATPVSACAAGFPPSFALSAHDLALAEKEVFERTRGLPGFYFEELRRVVVADADRRVFRGAKLPAAVTEAAAALGETRSARRYLAAVERGGPVPLALPRARRARGLLVLLTVLGALVFLRLFVVGVYRVAPEAVSMAPTLFPADEDGDGWVLVNLLADRFSNPDRGEVWIFRRSARPDPIVKRVMGLPGETMAIRGEDLFVNGRRLVKERAFLDRVSVPLFAREDFEETPAGGRLMPGWLRRQFRTPSGTLEPGYRKGRPLGSAALCRDIVVRSLVRLGRTSGAPFRGSGGTVTFQLESEHRDRPSIVTIVVGAQKTTVAVGGQLVEKPLPGLLGDGLVERAVEVWFTTADRTFRLEIDGEEIYRAPAPRTGSIRLRAVVQDARLDALDVARDLVHESESSQKEWRLGPEQYFLLGDNSSKSTDSRQLGPVHRADLHGRVWAVAWPPTRICRIR